MSNFFYGSLPISQITTTTGPGQTNAPGYSGFPVVPTPYSGLQPNDFLYYYTNPTNGIQPVSTLCTAILSSVYNPNTPGLTSEPNGLTGSVPANDVPASCKSISFYAISGGGGGGGGGGFGQINVNSVGTATADGGAGGNGGTGNYLWVYGVPVGTINYLLGYSGKPGKRGQNDPENYLAGGNDHKAQGNSGDPGGHGYTTEINIGGTTYKTNPAGNGGGGGGGGYMLQNTVEDKGILKTEFYPTPGNPGSPGNTPAQVNIPTPINVNFPPFANYGVGGPGGNLGQANGGPNGGRIGTGGAVQFIFLYD